PDLSADAQYRVPAEHCKRLLCEYARFVAQHYPSEKDPSAKPVRVKIYRVVHRLLEPNEMANPWEFPDPQAEWTYWPYYQGQFVPPRAAPNNLDPTRAWVLKDPKDPLLYWLIPIVVREVREEIAPPLKRRPGAQPPGPQAVIDNY